MNHHTVIAEALLERLSKEDRASLELAQREVSRARHDLRAAEEALKHTASLIVDRILPLPKRDS